MSSREFTSLNMDVMGATKRSSLWLRSHRESRATSDRCKSSCCSASHHHCCQMGSLDTGIPSCAEPVLSTMHITKAKTPPAAMRHRVPLQQPVWKPTVVIIREGNVAAPLQSTKLLPTALLTAECHQRQMEMQEL